MIKFKLTIDETLCCDCCGSIIKGTASEACAFLGLKQINKNEVDEVLCETCMKGEEKEK